MHPVIIPYVERSKIQILTNESSIISLLVVLSQAVRYVALAQGQEDPIVPLANGQEPRDGAAFDHLYDNSESYRYEYSHGIRIGNKTYSTQGSV